VALALPALDLYLGQQDNGALPRSTDARRAFDGLTTGFGPGTNGPLLISVDLSRQPASLDQANLDKLSTQEKSKKSKATKQANDQELQIAGKLEAEGLPPAQAKSQAGPRTQRPELLDRGRRVVPRARRRLRGRADRAGGAAAARCLVRRSRTVRNSRPQPRRQETATDCSGFGTMGAAGFEPATSHV
jgi:hypothetical protein